MSKTNGNHQTITSLMKQVFKLIKMNCNNNNNKKNLKESQLEQENNYLNKLE